MAEKVHNKHNQVIDKGLIHKTFPAKEIINDQPKKGIITDKHPNRLIIELEYIPTPKLYKGKYSSKLKKKFVGFISEMNLEEIMELARSLNSKFTYIYLIHGI